MLAFGRHGTQDPVRQFIGWRRATAGYDQATPDPDGTG
jgi:hypothetical protein